MSGPKPIRKNRFRQQKSKGRGGFLDWFGLGLKISVAAGCIILLSSALILGYDFLTQNDYFRAKDIDVEGEHRLSREVIIHQAQIAQGTNILSINLSTSRKRLLSHPLIVEAGVKREFPSRICISIREHQALAILDLGRKFVINVQGEIFREMDPVNPVKLPIISGLEYTDINVPRQPFSRPFNSVMEILRLGQEDGSVLPNRVIKRIHVDRDIGLTLYTRDQVKAVRLGYEDFASKYDRLRSILYFLKVQPNFSDIDSIDLNNLNRIVINPSRRELPADSREEV